ncbi:CAP domain-containing protein [Halorussus amylolyticus]|uniref:CAP domain-containing protein n=1 Tax=Halorussus amylolyticus TaxID=1126242 RepID=UPI00138F4228|nr:CAP domain-containing protein [Halorussus amylolyticus]
MDATAVTVDENWKTVRLSDSHSDPVVVAPALSYRGPQPASPRLRNVTDSAFDIAVEEWLYLDGPHREETVGCVATDPGRYGVGDLELEVGRVRTNHDWTAFEFDSAFATTPLVFTHAQTVAGPQPMVTRNRGVSRSGAAVRVQEEEAQGPHRFEDVGYLAVEPGSGTLDGRAFEAGSRSGVGHGWETIEFDGDYREPVLLADVQTFRGSNTCSVRYRNLGGSSVDVKVEEERSADRETAHLGERVGYFVVEGADEEDGEADDREESDESTPLSDLDRDRIEDLVHEHVNERRSDHGLGAVDFDTDLREIARSHSEDMAENDYFSHESPDGETRSDRYDEFGYDCRAYIDESRYYTGGENIAYTYYDANVATDDGTVRYTTADELAEGVVRGWMNSEGHRENILTEAWNNEGIGVYVTSEGKVYATQNFC